MSLLTGKTVKKLSAEVKQYLVVTGNYWAFTLTDGALRMLVLLHFYGMGYSPFEVASLFLFYEIFGVITNLFGGWLGARIGLNKTMNLGLGFQILALAMLLVPSEMLTVIWVMAAQALSGIAKDLNKMSAKTSIKLMLPSEAEGALYKWVAILTGSKNTLKGVGFFLGGLLLSTLGFTFAIATMAAGLTVVWLSSLLLLKKDLGKKKHKPKFSEVFSDNKAINLLAAARLFLFASRDVWFVIALPVYLSQQFGWDFWQVGGYLAVWIIGYGFVQTAAPWLTGTKSNAAPGARSAAGWALMLSFIPAAIAYSLGQQFNPEWVLLFGLIVFALFFAVNSSLHSYLIVGFAREDGASMDVGFYYMANALGRLIGTVLSGWVYQTYGLEECLYISSAMVLFAMTLTLFIDDSSVNSSN